MKQRAHFLLCNKWYNCLHTLFPFNWMIHLSFIWIKFALIYAFDSNTFIQNELDTWQIHFVRFNGVIHFVPCANDRVYDEISYFAWIYDDNAKSGELKWTQKTIRLLLSYSLSIYHFKKFSNGSVKSLKSLLFFHLTVLLMWQSTDKMWFRFEINISTIKLSFFNSHNHFFLLLCSSSFLSFGLFHWDLFGLQLNPFTLKFKCNSHQWQRLVVQNETTLILSHWQRRWERESQNVAFKKNTMVTWEFETWINHFRFLYVLKLKQPQIKYKKNPKRKKNQATEESRKKSNQRPFTIVDINQGANEV